MRAVPRKIDLHTHILPESMPDLNARYGRGGFMRLEPEGPGRARMMIDDTCFRVVEDNLWSPDRRLEECDRHGVDLQVLSTVPVMFAYWADAEQGHDLARLLNDHLATVVARHSDRFAGLGTVPLQAPDRAVRELERCVRALGFAGVQIGTHANGVNLDDASLFPLFEAAQDLDAAVFVHPWDMMASERMKKFWLSWLVGMPAETALAIGSVIFSGLLEKLPRLRIGFAHGGGAFPGTASRMQRGFEARPDLCAVDTRMAPREQLGRFYVDSLVHDADTLRFLIGRVGADRIALGSDYPFPLGEAEPGRLIESMSDLDEATRRRLLAGTAREFLGLDRAPATP